MPIRNPFKKSTGLDGIDPLQRDAAEKGFQQTNVVGARPLDVKEPTEYKLSEINDSGVYLPPSPAERKSSFWSPSRTSLSSNHRSFVEENEAFTISRESFDSYRRSFDISARSPIPSFDLPRASLDSRRAMPTRPPRTSLHERRMPFQGAADDGFEEVGLNDDAKPKKRGFLSKLGDIGNSNNSNANGGQQADGRPSSSGHHGFSLLPGRKRGQSGGAELKSMDRPESKGNPTSVVV